MLLALGLAVGNLAARDSSLVFLIWVHAIAPGLIGAWLLVGPQFGLMSAKLQLRLGVA